MKKNFELFLSLFIVTVVMMLGIAYSVSTRLLSIDTSSAEIRIIKDIRVTGVSVSSSSSGTSSLEDYNVSNISGNITLPNSDSYIKYKVQVTNIGNTEMGILNITGLPSNLEYELEDYNLKDKICNTSSSCSLGIVKEFYVTIKYKNGYYDSLNTSYNFVLNFDFQEAYSVTLDGLLASVTYPRTVLNSDTLEINIGTNFDSSNLNLEIGGVKTTNFTYSATTGIFRVSNVSGDVYLKYEVLPDFYIDGSKAEITTDRISASTPISVKDLIDTMTFDAMNSSDKRITKIEYVFTYSNITGSKQSIHTHIVLNGQTIESPALQFNGNVTNQTASVSMNTNIGINESFIIDIDADKITNGSVNITGFTIRLTFS